MKQLITADLHLTCREVDSYRWCVFPRLIDLILKRGVGQLIILGDLTEEKDNHNGVLVNRIVKEFVELAKLAPIYILEGNHDFSTDAQSYWDFLNRLENIQYIKETEWNTYCDGWFVPYGKELPEALEKEDTLFLHHLVMGAQYQNIKVKKGLPPQSLPNLTISGHIHKPQKLLKRRGEVIYVGSPHSVDFGDHFEPRVLLRDLETQTISSLAMSSTVKWSVKIKAVQELEEYSLRSGDWIKVELETPPENIMELKEELANYLQGKGVTLSGFSIKKLEVAPLREASKNFEKARVFEEFCGNNGLEEDYINLAIKLME